MGAVACGGCMHQGQIKSCCIGMGAARKRKAEGGPIFHHHRRRCRSEEMKGKRSSILDLDRDALRHIMVRLGRSENGYADLARATSVCKVFKNLAGEKEILRTVKFKRSCLSHPCESFWHMDGLLSKCTRVGNHTAYRVLLEHVKEQSVISNKKSHYFHLAMEDYAEKMGAVEAVCTRARSKAAGLAWEEVLRRDHEVQMSSRLIRQHIEAMQVSVTEMTKASNTR